MLHVRGHTRPHLGRARHLLPYVVDVVGVVFLASHAFEELVERKRGHGPLGQLEESALGIYRYVLELRHDGGFTNEEIKSLKSDERIAYLGAYASING